MTELQLFERLTVFPRELDSCKDSFPTGGVPPSPLFFMAIVISNPTKFTDSSKCQSVPNSQVTPLTCRVLNRKINLKENQLESIRIKPLYK